MNDVRWEGVVCHCFQIISKWILNNISWRMKKNVNVGIYYNSIPLVNERRLYTKKDKYSSIKNFHYNWSLSIQKYRQEYNQNIILWISHLNFSMFFGTFSIESYMFLLSENSLCSRTPFQFYVTNFLKTLKAPFFSLKRKRNWDAKNSIMRLLIIKVIRYKNFTIFLVFWNVKEMLRMKNR